ncbi:Na+/H+ antiporter subunit D [Anoxybacillus sp. LAT_35]|uniref:Na+/H+ antiporter subunit D n=1 Tax=Anoxybacillus TaxID=150247 RepID=UPI001EEC5C7E|nr:MULTISPECIES: Na+/H+ antiporter subunit D [Anoxybacillus]MCG6195702.1 Na+/H+ antiporter subunit D [Anoxybacillus sp. LAT_38]MCG6171350.1 Na+/H+ antiporter subunit D [Anoxybacillus sp. LAT_11]MCG6178706.1 Na+/H+ antiporter subunit D [Anoxybacillus sp. LAT_35]MCG6182802.1 Na+/H+ antiporter subunit D [Anoxybacillus sp. LAT_26]MCG6185568.1 Na+/H+ antiporter subunit D [Anoxybacillus sp. LAT_26]
MSNLLLLPILIPLVTAIVLIFFPKHVFWQRAVSFIATVSLIVASSTLLYRVHTDGIQTLNIGNWPAPFGITLVSDSLSALLVLTTSIIALACLVYSFYAIGHKRETFYYYSFFQFLIVGVNGAFTTGDLFNLFVFFEVMLMSSYVLLVLGGTKIQLRETIKYTLVNVISSALFVVAVAYLYAVTGTLNMAHLADRINALGSSPILTVIAVLFIIVFGLKGAIFPLYFWLPGAYYAPPTPVLALFGGLLTKVGVYSILRTFTLLFTHDAAYTHTLLAWLALGTIIIGVIGAVAYNDMRYIVIYNIIAAVGVMIFGISIMTPESLEGTIFYLLQDMVMKAMLFLFVGIIFSITRSNDIRSFSGLITSYPLLGWAFFIAALSLAGIPPLSGFIGKLLIVKASFDAQLIFEAIVILLSSLLVLYSVMKIFMNGFWGEKKGFEQKQVDGRLFPVLFLLVLSVAYGIGIEFVRPFVLDAVNVLVDPSMYIEAVLKE